MLIVIGSTVMQNYLPNRREPKDLDLFTNQSVSFKGDIFWHESMLDYWFDDENRMATLSELYTIKCSHVGWELRNGSWDKHMSDIAALKEIGAELIPDLYKILYKVWEELHGSKQLKLKKGKDDFFTDAVVRQYDHDSLHASVAYGEHAMYEDVLKPGSTVDVDMAKIKGLSWEEQIKLYREEVYATALERLVIPSGYTYSPRRAYAWALRRTITSLTKGWSSLFLIENYDVMRKPDVDYVKVHLANKDKLIPMEV